MRFEHIFPSAAGEQEDQLWAGMQRMSDTQNIIVVIIFNSFFLRLFNRKICPILSVSPFYDDPMARRSALARRFNCPLSSSHEIMSLACNVKICWFLFALPSHC